MRPGQNKRMRGRPNNNRRGPNPLTRAYESNGPDVKIRGNAHHVAEKYLQLARDAHTNGDPVAAENYLQHAEHYFRLIASAQAAQAQQQNGGLRAPGEADGEEFDEEDDGGAPSDRFASPAERAPPAYQPQPAFAPIPAQPQPFQDRGPYDSDRQPQPDRGYQGRPDRPHNRPPDRGPRDNRPYQERQDFSRDNRDGRDNRFPRDNRQRDFRPYRDANPPREAPGAGEAGHSGALPSFITAPARAGGAAEGDNGQFSSRGGDSESVPAGGADAAPVGVGPIEGMESTPRYPGRGRRRRPRPSFSFDSPQDDHESGGSEQPSRTDETPAGE
jgi:hypothetical protein